MGEHLQQAGLSLLSNITRVRGGVCCQVVQALYASRGLQNSRLPWTLTITTTARQRQQQQEETGTSCMGMLAPAAACMLLLLQMHKSCCAAR
jgi:hypothetical protein